MSVSVIWVCWVVRMLLFYIERLNVLVGYSEMSHVPFSASCFPDWFLCEGLFHV
jgi:hypothetical protein